MRNVNSYRSSVWVSYNKKGCSWENVSTHPIIGENNTMEIRGE